MNIKSLLACATLALLVEPALAADAPPPPMLVRGTITNIDANSITIAKNDGTTLTAGIVPATVYSAVEARRFDQIKPTDFVGITSVPGPNDTMKAEEIHIIPLKGLGEGSYPWDHHPSNDAPATAGSMTNGTVAVVHDKPTAQGSMTNGTVTTSNGMELKVTYHGSALVNEKCVGLAKAAPEGKTCIGVATVVVSPSTPIVAIVAAKATDAKAGLAVFAAVGSDAAGKPVVGSIVLEKNGIKPPM